MSQQHLDESDFFQDSIHPSIVINSNQLFVLCQSSVGKGVLETEGKERTPGSSFEYNICLVSQAKDKQVTREKQEVEEYSNQFIEDD